MLGKSFATSKGNDAEFKDCFSVLTKDKNDVISTSRMKRSMRLEPHPVEDPDELDKIIEEARSMSLPFVEPGEATSEEGGDLKFDAFVKMMLREA